MIRTPPRRTETELLDQGVGTLDDVRTNLMEMWRLNRWFGGVSAITRHLFPTLRGSSSTVHIADIGAGSGQLALYLSNWAVRNRVCLRLYPLDISHRNLTIARETVRSNPMIRPLQADGLALPFAVNAIDYFISTLVLHHFEPDALVVLLRHTFERARRGIIMSDITRGTLPLAAFRLTQPFVAPHPLTRHDGVVSIRRAYTPDELLTFARTAGLHSARVHRHSMWRMTLVAEKAGAVTEA